MMRFSGIYDASGDVTLPKIFLWQLRRLFTRWKPRPFSPLDIIRDTQKLSREDDFVCWLGHASVLIQLDGTRIVVDPVFGDIPFYGRKSPAPYSAGEISPVDAVLVTHTHYDHCDVPSLQALQHDEPLAVVPLNACSIVTKHAPRYACTELAWYESTVVGKLRITFVPARHMSRRGPFDNNTVLWGSFVVESSRHTLFIAGDSGPGSHFAEIGKRFAVDTAVLPVGAYAPAYIMEHHHLSPEQAYDAFKALGAKTMIPVHYGTFDLSDEPLDEPLALTRRLAAEHPGDIRIVRCGEVAPLKSRETF